MVIQQKQKYQGYKKYWLKLIAHYGARCFYCQDEPATCIDHVLPLSWSTDNSIDNLVPSCGLCNIIAGSKIFSDVNHKKQYIRERRKSKNKRRAICTDCLLPYVYLTHSPSLFLCAFCYDDEYKTRYSKKKGWKLWIEQMEKAGISALAHQAAKKRLYPYLVGNRNNKDALIELITDEYVTILDKDDGFALFLCQ